MMFTTTIKVLGALVLSLSSISAVSASPIAELSTRWANYSAIANFVEYAQNDECWTEGISHSYWSTLSTEQGCLRAEVPSMSFYNLTISSAPGMKVACCARVYRGHNWTCNGTEYTDYPLTVGLNQTAQQCILGTYPGSVPETEGVASVELLCGEY